MSAATTITMGLDYSDDYVIHSMSPGRTTKREPQKQSQAGQPQVSQSNASEQPEEQPQG